MNETRGHEALIWRKTSSKTEETFSSLLLSIEIEY